MGWANSRTQPMTPPHLPHTTGRFYTNVLEQLTATLTPAIDTLYAVPFFVPVAKTYTVIGVETTTAQAAKSVQLGVYTDVSGVPSARVFDAGNVSLATPTAFKSITISQALAVGWYWLAGVFNSTTAAVRATAQSAPMHWLGFTSGTDTTLHPGWSVAFTYAALPNPFTGGGALMTGNVPRFMMGI